MAKEEYCRPEDMKIHGFDADIKEIDKEQKTVTAYVSTITKDSYNEVVLPVFNLDRFRKNPVVLWAHEYWTPPIAKSLWQKTDDKGLIAKSRFQTSTQIGADIWNLYAEGFLKAFSIGYVPRKRVKPGDDEWAELFEQYNFDASAREIHSENELWEYSAVPVPANPDAVADAIKSGVVKSDQVRHAFEHSLQEHIEQTLVETSGDESNAKIIELLTQLNDKIDKINSPEQRTFLYAEALQVEKAMKEKTNPQPQVEAETSVPTSQNGEVSSNKNGSAAEVAVSFEELKKRIPKIVDGAISEMTGKNL